MLSQAHHNGLLSQDVREDFYHVYRKKLQNDENFSQEDHPRCTEFYHLLPKPKPPAEADAPPKEE